MHTIHFNNHDEVYTSSADAYSRFAAIVEEAATDSGITFCYYNYNGNTIVSWKYI